MSWKNHKWVLCDKKELFLGVYKLWKVCEDYLYRYAVVSKLTRDAAVAIGLSNSILFKVLPWKCIR